MTDTFIVKRPRRGTSVRRHTTPVAELDQTKRAKTVGASEIATVVGRSEFKNDTRLGLFNTKTGRAPRRRGTERMRFGLALEQIIADEFSFRTGIELEGDGRTTYTHPDLPWASATPDRFVAGRKELVEIKNVGQQNIEKWGEQFTDEIPVGYKLQAQWQMFVMDADRVYVAAFIGGNELRIYLVERRQDIIDECVQAAALFASHIERDIPPSEETGLAPEVEDLLDLYATRTSAEPIAEATPVEVALTADYVRARRLADRATGVVKKIESAMKLLLGDRAGWILPNGAGTVTYKAPAASVSTDYEAVVREMVEVIPKEVIEKHTSITAGSRRFVPTMAMRNLEKLPPEAVPYPASWEVEMDGAIRFAETDWATKLESMAEAVRLIVEESSASAYEAQPIPEADVSVASEDDGTPR